MADTDDDDRGLAIVRLHSDVRSQSKFVDLCRRERARSNARCSRDRGPAVHLAQDSIQRVERRLAGARVVLQLCEDLRPEMRHRSMRLEPRRGLATMPS